MIVHQHNMVANQDVTDVVHRPSTSDIEDTNVWQFMTEHGMDDIEELRTRSMESVDGVDASGLEWFWDQMISTLDIEFYTPYDRVRDDSGGPQFTEWYPGGTINVAHNVLDRHANTNADTRNRAACIWEGETGETRTITFHDLARQSNRVANVLQNLGVTQGDRVGLYMPMVPEVISILYGCFKVGAVAVPIFSGFGVDATATRLADAGCSVVFTGDGFYRRGEEIELKSSIDAAIEEADNVEDTIVYDRLGTRSANGTSETPDIHWDEERDAWWNDTVGVAEASFETVEVAANDPAMLLYSSGTTGKPKGIVQTHAGALVQPAKEIYFGFDWQPSDRFFWVSDIGWMMGPWTLIGNHNFGGTVIMYEGAPDHPEPDRFWDLIERHGVTTFGVSPTAIRALQKYGDEWVDQHDLSSIRLLGSTGEPWDPESWLWYYERVGGGEAPIINISGGTEICGCFLMPMPIEPLKPCTLGGPGLGMDVDIVDQSGTSILHSGERGHLVARDSCPSMTKSLWSGDDRYLEEYWSTWEDLWDHGDWAQRDDDGFWFLHGRADDVLNVAGRKVGPAEIESAVVDHPHVTQAAAIGVPDETTGTAVVVYAVAEPAEMAGEDLRKDLRDRIGEDLGKPFRPSEIRFVEELPFTQSGKIVRRAVQAAHTGESVGDTSSIENPEALEAIRAAT
jgi:acetyl-CoA synthetase